MTRKQLREGLELVAERFAVPLQAHFVAQCWALFADLPGSLWAEACQRAKNWLRFPEPAEFWRFVPPPHWSRGKQGYADPEHAKAAMALIQRISQGNCRGADREAAFVALAERFPGIGWEEAAMFAMRDAEREPEEARP